MKQDPTNFQMDSSLDGIKEEKKEGIIRDWSLFM